MARIKWESISEDKFRSSLGTVMKRATGWFYYRRGERKATTALGFSSKAAVIRHATGGE